MMLRFVALAARRAGLVLLPVPLLSCLDLLAPDSLEPVPIQFCSDVFDPNWFAFYNEGYGWRGIPTSTLGQTRFVVPSARRVTIAFGYTFAAPDGGFSNLVSLHVYHLTREELRAFQCPEEQQGEGGLGGYVINAAPPVELRAGAALGWASAPDFQFSFGGAPDTIGDLVARESAGRVFLRHDVDFAAAPAPRHVIDFAGPEAAPLDSTTVDFGVGSRVDKLDFTTRNGTRMGIPVPFGLHAVWTVPMVPERITAEGDLHSVSATSQQTALIAYFRTGPVTLSFGPPLAVPAVRETRDVRRVGASAIVLPRTLLQVRLPFQAEYPTFARATFHQDSNYSTPCTKPPVCVYSDTRRVTVAASAAYLGGNPATWELTVPDLSGAPGYNSDRWDLRKGVRTSVCVEAWDMVSPAFFGGTAGATDGLIMRGAAASAMTYEFSPPCRPKLARARAF